MARRSLQELTRKIRRLQAEVAKLKRADKPGMRELVALLKKHKLGLSDVKIALDAAKPVARRSTSKARRVKPKYRNPKDGSQCWAGRGRMPRWMADLVKNGEKPENLLIGPARSIDAQKANGNGPAEPTHCAMPAAPHMTSACLQEMPGAILEAPEVVSGCDDEPRRLA